MSASSITTALATDDDAPVLASIITAAFSGSDAAYPLIWGGAAEGTHDKVSVMGLFTPVQQEGRVTYKAVSESGEVIGFATWRLPKANSSEDVKVKAQSGTEGKKEDKGGLPDLPGVNMDLWKAKMNGMKEFRERDFDVKRDMTLIFLFVHPKYQRQGIGSWLMAWGKTEADARQARIFLTATPQARQTYEMNGWMVRDARDFDLSKFGGEGVYTRYWMCREPGKGK